MDVEANLSEPGECEADSCADLNDQPVIKLARNLAVGDVECESSVKSTEDVAAVDEDDGELESDSASEPLNDPSSPCTERDTVCSGQLLLKRSINRIHESADQKSRLTEVCDAKDANAVHETNEDGSCNSNPDGEEGYFEDDRSQTPLQDEPDAGSEVDPEEVGDDDESEADSKVQPHKTSSRNKVAPDTCSMNEKSSLARSDNANDKNQSEVDNKLKAVSVLEVPRKQSVRDDLGELDYEEDENQEDAGRESGADSSDEEGTEENVGKKVSKKETKKKEKSAMKDDVEKEEGEALEEGEEVDQEDDEQEEGEHSTDGELDDDDDCEEGEIKEPGQRKPFVRPICRFYMRGNCTWGHSCRFLHPGVNDKGSYAMIDQAPFPHPGPPPPGMMVAPMGPGGRGPLPPPPGPWMHEGPPRRLPRGPMDMGPPMMEPDLPPPPVPSTDASSESAWERGLRHAKEIRKKRKENDPVFEDKKDGSSPKEERITSPLPPPARDIPAHLPPPREAFFEEQPLPVPVFDEDFYGRPVLPPPPEAWQYRPPFDPYDPRWGRGPPLDFPHPPHFMPPPPDFRMQERDRGHRFSPPRFDARRDPRFNPWFDRFPPDGPPRDQGPPMAGGDLQPPAMRGRGEEWKDPWLRSRSPKRKRNSSSRSVSRGRRRYRTRSKGSFSSVSSSSYSSNSRSRSGSSSSYSSYSKSSYSRSSYSSRSSSVSRSRSKSGRKRLPATTLGQSLLEKRKVHSEIHRPSASHTETLAIGSGPLPARAPPEKKSSGVSSQIQTKSTTPRPVAPPSVQELSKPITNTTVPPAGVPLPSSKSLPKLALSQPIPVSSRVALQPVGRGVAAAFADQEEADDDFNDPPAAKSVETPTVRPLSPPAFGSEKERSGRERTVAYNRTSSMPGDKETDNGSLPGSRSAGATVSVAGDRALPAVVSRNERLEIKGVPGRDFELVGRPPNVPGGEKGRSSSQNILGSDKDAAATSKKSSGRGNRARDQFGRQKPEMGKNVAGKLASNSSRSSSAESQRSLSSLSLSSAEHLYDDIASPISSNSSLSPIESTNTNKVPAPISAPKLKRPPSPRRAPPKTPPLHAQYPLTATHRADKPRDSAQQREPVPRGLPRESARDGQMRDVRREGRDPFREGGVPHRPASHRQDVQRQGSSRGLPMEASREIRRDIGDMRERDRGHQLQVAQAGHGQSSSQHREGGNRRVGSARSSGGGRLPEDMRLKSNMMSLSGGRNALPPPPRPSESTRVMEGRGGSDARSQAMKPDMKMIPKVEKGLVSAHSSSAGRKRAADYCSEMPSAKHMRHASDVRSPVKMTAPRKEKPTPVSPSRSGGRSSGTSATGTLRSPVKSSLPVPPLKPPVIPSNSGSNSSNSAAKPRKSTSSRREELLLQLKAVEDAIAKKRSKLQ